MRAANQLFDDRLRHDSLPRVRSQDAGRANDAPLAITETPRLRLAGQGGKRFRPFITLAAYDALTGAGALRSDSSDGSDAPKFSDAVSRVGHGHRGLPQGVAGPRRHRGRRPVPLRPATRCIARYGLGTAINVGDYLIGLGYRLVSSAAEGTGRRRRRRHPRPHGRRPTSSSATARGPKWSGSERRGRRHPAGRAEDLRPEDVAGLRGGPVRRAAAGRARRSVRGADPGVLPTPGRRASRFSTT